MNGLTFFFQHACREECLVVPGRAVVASLCMHINILCLLKENDMQVYNDDSSKTEWVSKKY